MQVFQYLWYINFQIIELIIRYFQIIKSIYAKVYKFIIPAALPVTLPVIPKTICSIFPFLNDSTLLVFTFIQLNR